MNLISKTSKLIGLIGTIFGSVVTVLGVGLFFAGGFNTVKMEGPQGSEATTMNVGRFNYKQEGEGMPPYDKCISMYRDMIPYLEKTIAAAPQAQKEAMQKSLDMAKDIVRGEDMFIAGASLFPIGLVAAGLSFALFGVCKKKGE